MMKKISDAPALVGSIFHLAVSGKQILPWPLTEVIDKVLFRRVKSATGGRLRLAVCGGKHRTTMVADDRWSTQSRDSVIHEHCTCSDHTR